MARYGPSTAEHIRRPNRGEDYIFGRETTGWELLFGFAVIFIVDPALACVRRRFSKDYPRYVVPKRLFLAISYSVPALAGLTSVLLTFRLSAPDVYWMWLVVSGMGCWIGRYFHNRANDRLASLGVGLTAQPDDPEFANDLYDLMAIVWALAVVVGPIAPLLSH